MKDNHMPFIAPPATHKGQLRVFILAAISICTIKGMNVIMKASIQNITNQKMVATVRWRSFVPNEFVVADSYPFKSLKIANSIRNKNTAVVMKPTYARILRRLNIVMGPIDVVVCWSLVTMGIRSSDWFNCFKDKDKPGCRH